MHHYVQELASWFDVLDPAQHFARVVPHRAAQCVPLQQAIFALSARHLSRISDMNPYISDQYFKRCIDVLMPVINETQAIIEEDILCAMVCLRLLEELDVPLSGCDNQRHLKGIQVLVNAQARSAATAGGLFQAAF
ncbi:hypothetical protein BU16DRAFT_613226 [Lophium mytilinum]|uniref:Uncharacterized protein n=1 Tax=Lophium mytilinum TaxID=390894 RepID=A0A6A6R979_9PEZI|nr:hypothetical protein BU16DRAFT_613226 [Lophium mytilinum]